MITLTDNAAVKVKDLITQEGNDELMLRVAVRPGGCSGFSYEMFFDTDQAGDDLITDYSGVKVVVDPSSAQLLTGATLDYTDGL
ncbi:MAG TPA: iron-sulfur cluster assembly accessory protein, partial [Acidimicrobiales bacterium]